VNSEESDSVRTRESTSTERVLATVLWRKLSYCGHVMRKRGDSLEKEIMQEALHDMDAQRQVIDRSLNNRVNY